MRKLCIGQEALVYESAIIKQTWAEIIIFWREKQWINDVTSHPTIIIFDGFQICDASATTKTSLRTKILWCLNVVLNNSLKDRVLFISTLHLYVYTGILHFYVYFLPTVTRHILKGCTKYAYKMNLILVKNLAHEMKHIYLLSQN